MNFYKIKLKKPTKIDFTHSLEKKIINLKNN